MTEEIISRGPESQSEVGFSQPEGKYPEKKRKARKKPEIDPRIEALAKAAKTGELGHGLKLIAALGDDREAVLRQMR